MTSGCTESTKELAGAETLCALLEEVDKALGAGKEEAAEGVVEQIASFLRNKCMTEALSAIRKRIWTLIPESFFIRRVTRLTE